IEPGAEQILLSRLALLAWDTASPLDSPPPNRVNHAPQHKGIAKPNCRKTALINRESCNSKAAIRLNQHARSMACE
ncbi:hypothetical protein, partial [Mesorhizobium sp.]|uniref:hypothetical protein n=1 Tax=Mesorhizobium sp. TaxID=1871066 RepID=UPI00257F3BEB